MGGKFLSRPETTTKKRPTTDPVSEHDVSQTELSEHEEPTWLTAVRAAESKKATDIKVLDLSGITTFTDYFVLCNGSNPKQMQAITDEVALRLKKRGERATSIEGYDQGEWILSDYSDLIVHVFSEKARGFYDLDRLWRQGTTVMIPAEE
ncbi:MAG TPA: ribosome silencing factor [Bryobacteraceae bacterium]|nr:ribosome silencing factor [Bryobacteraceae bacterium]